MMNTVMMLCAKQLCPLQHPLLNMMEVNPSYIYISSYQIDDFM